MRFSLASSRDTSSLSTERAFNKEQNHRLHPTKPCKKSRLPGGLGRIRIKTFYSVFIGSRDNRSSMELTSAP
jgi:hypothetical protein